MCAVNFCQLYPEERYCQRHLERYQDCYYLHCLPGLIDDYLAAYTAINVSKGLLGVLQAVAHLGNDAFVGVIAAVCKSLGVSSFQDLYGASF